MYLNLLWKYMMDSLMAEKIQREENLPEPPIAANNEYLLIHPSCYMDIPAQEDVSQRIIVCSRYCNKDDMDPPVRLYSSMSFRSA